MHLNVTMHPFKLQQLKKEAFRKFRQTNSCSHFVFVQVFMRTLSAWYAVPFFLMNRNSINFLCQLNFLAEFVNLALPSRDVFRDKKKKKRISAPSHKTTPKPAMPL